MLIRVPATPNIIQQQLIRRLPSYRDYKRAETKQAEEVDPQDTIRTITEQVMTNIKYNRVSTCLKSLMMLTMTLLP